MKYAEIDTKTARKCCKQHSYKNKNGYVIPKCETCPLRRLNTEGKPGLCWYVIKSLHENNLEKNAQCEFLKAEYDALMKENVSFQVDWDNWIASQETLP